MLSRIAHRKFCVRKFYTLTSYCDQLLDVLYDKVRDLDEIPRSFSITSVDVFRLDPGGSMCTGEEFVQFNICGIDFEIQLSVASWVLDRIKQSDKETILYHVAIRLYDTDECFLVLPIHIVELLNNKLEELDASDATLHAKITRSEKMLCIEEVSNGSVFYGEMHPS